MHSSEFLIFLKTQNAEMTNAVCALVNTYGVCLLEGPVKVWYDRGECHFNSSASERTSGVSPALFP